MRLPATRYLSAGYAVAFGGLVALGLYLPACLRQLCHLSTDRAVLGTAGCLTLAAARPLGCWLCRRHDPVPLLRACFTGAAAIGLILAFQPALPVAAPVLFGLAGCRGAASGAAQAIIAATAPPEHAGAIVGGVGGLARLLPRHPRIPLDRPRPVGRVLTNC